MGFKCTPQLVGLVRGEPKPDSKHRANGGKICEEAGNERYSRSETLDRTRSKFNEYELFKSGGECWETMCEDAARYRIKGKTKNGKTFERSLREDAVIGWAMIFNPPADMCLGWAKEEYKRFYQDSFEVMQEIEPRLFRPDNIRMTATHRDEGIIVKDGDADEHKHLIGDAIDENGRYCGNLIDAKLFVTINEKYPKAMRERGWELDDLDLTDFKRCGENEEYKAERNAKRRKSGRSVNRYRADVSKKILQETKELMSQVEQLEQQARADAGAARKDRIAAAQEREAVEKDMKAAANVLESIRKDKQALNKSLSAYEAQIGVLKNECEDYIENEFKRLNEPYTALQMDDAKVVSYLKATGKWDGLAENARQAETQRAQEAHQRKKQEFKEKLKKNPHAGASNLLEVIADGMNSTYSGDYQRGF